MSPARLHRERLAADAATLGPNTPIESGEGGGQTAAPAPLPPMTPAREHRMTTAIAAMSQGDALRDVAALVGDPITAQMRLRLQHDLRRLKEIASIERKIDAKREMLPAYREWCDSIVAAANTGEPVADEIVPTVMVWCIDIGDWPRALELATYVVTFDVPLPSRYVRAGPALITEEIATVAIKAQSAGQPFPLDVLEDVEALTAGADMHDEIRAKLQKAIGFELARAAEAFAPATPEFVAAAERALVPLRRAQQLHDRAGAKDKIKRLEKALAPPKAAPKQAGTPPAA